MDVQRTIEANIEKRTKEIYGPPPGKRLVVFMDDMNMPQVKFSYVFEKKFWSKSLLKNFHLTWEFEIEKYENVYSWTPKFNKKFGILAQL